jgi:hypothetical protein
MAPCLGMQNATQYTRFNRHFIYIINLLWLSPIVESHVSQMSHFPFQPE